MIEVSPAKWLLLTGKKAFPETSRCHWNSECQAYMFKPAHKLRFPEYKPVTQCRTALADSSVLVMDSFNQLGRISADGKSIQYNAGYGFKNLRDEDYSPVTAPAGTFSFLTIGGQVLLAAAYSDNNTHGVSLFHLRHRWQFHLPVADAILSCTIDPHNNLWLVSQKQLFLCQGNPLHLPFTSDTSSTGFKPLNDNPLPLHIVSQKALPENFTIVSIQYHNNCLYLLGDQQETPQQTRQLLLKCAVNKWQKEDFSVYKLALTGNDSVDSNPVTDNRDSEILPYITDFLLREDDSLLLMTFIHPDEYQHTTYIDSLNIRLKDNNEIELLKISFPLIKAQTPRFIHRPDGQAYYLSMDGPRALSVRQQILYPHYGLGTIRQHMDSGSSRTVWHRIYLDARIPRGSRVILYAGVYNTSRKGLQYHRQAELLWNPLQSELAFTANPAGQQKNQAGLFEVLLQTGQGNIRQLRGRYLALKIVLLGNGHLSPQIYNIRVYYPRFCYQEAYLPPHFQQQEAPDPSHTQANGADVRERMLASFEAMLTPIEARIANMDVLYNSQSSQLDFLPLLAQLLGSKLPEHWPESRQRRYIQNLGNLQRWNGTLKGLQLILDIITDGAVASGQVIIVENFRLRRTMATLLGVEMTPKDNDQLHPLTLGTEQSGNSIIGDNLILSDKNARAFLALVDPQLKDQTDQQAVKTFFDRYSHQTSILLHGDSRKLRSLVYDTLQKYMPAHIQWQIYNTDYPFILGLSPLLEVNSFIEQRPAPKSVQVNNTYLGYEGLLTNKAALSPDDINTINH